MKKIFSLIAILAVAAGFASCSEDAFTEGPAIQANKNGKIEVKAYIGNAETRTSLSDKTADGKYNVLWAVGDKIMIGSKEYELISGEGTTNATFLGDLPGADGEYEVFYPSTYNGTTWPNQKYTGDADISGAPMVATATVSNGEIAALSFQNVGGILRYTFKGSKTIRSINFKGQGLDITLNCGSGVALTSEGTVFNIALPEGTYSNATLNVVATDGTMATKTASTFKVGQNKVSLATFEAGDLNFNNKSEEREALEAIYHALNGENWIDQGNWCTDAPLSEWKGLYFSEAGEDGSIKLETIQLHDSNVSGVIPRDFEKLSSLTRLSIAGGNLDALEGTVPEWIGNLSNLQVLEILYFAQEGALPESITNLKKLEYIYIPSSHLTSVPDNIFEELPLLTKLDLGYNQLTKLPESIGLGLNRYFEKEEYKDLPIWWGTSFEGNRLSGRLPESLTSSPYWGKAWPQVIYQQFPGCEIDLQGIDLPALEYKYYDTHDNLVNYADVYKQNDYTLVFDFCNAYGAGVNYLDKLYPIYSANKDNGFEVLITTEDENVAINPDWKLIKLDLQKNNPWIFYRGDKPMVDVVDKNGNIILTNRGICLKNDDRTDRSLDDIYKFLIDTYGAPELYASTDYSADGNVVTLQSATAGNGIDIVLMGDAFTDQMIADGTYEREMRHAMDQMFSDPLMDANKKYFNVKYVNAVSKNGLYLDGAETAFKVDANEENTRIIGDHSLVLEYAKKAVGEESIDDCLVLVVANKKTTNGTCYMFTPETPTDYGSGLSICYTTTGLDEEEIRRVVLHEVLGHGIGKLDDEYSEYDGYPEEMTEEKKALYLTRFGWGFYKNIDFSSNPSTVKWSKFITDTRYADENIGVYEGGAVTSVGVYRPTGQSIMRYHWETDQFNAPSREAIWYRIHKIAYGADWQYNYEDFVTEDLALKRGATRAKNLYKKADNVNKAKKLQHSQPVFINKTWRDLLR